MSHHLAHIKITDSNVLLCNTNVTVFQFMKWIEQFVGEERATMEHVEDKFQKKLSDSKSSFDLCDTGKYWPA